MGGDLGAAEALAALTANMVEATEKNSTSTRLEVALHSQQLKFLEHFQRSEGLPSREAALSLLLEIALEVVTGTGDRFWDKTAPSPGNEPPRRLKAKD